MSTTRTTLWPNTGTLRVLLTLGVILTASLCTAGELKLSVPVRFLPKTAPASNATQMPPGMQRPPTQPTTPGGKLPQYQLDHIRRGDNSVDADNSSLRIILALPAQAILVEANITVDGKAFRRMREDCVAEILKFVADPIAWKEQSKRAALRNNPAEAATSILEGVKNVFDQVVAAAPDVEKAEDSEAGDKPKDTDTDQADLVPEVPAYVAPNSLFERIERYMAATGEAPNADEVRWILTNWVDGPALLYLNDNFQRFRADQTPVFNILDRDRNGKVSPEEMELAVKSFQDCDLNRNDIVEHTEIAEVANDPRDEATHAGFGKLIYALPDHTNAAFMYQRLAQQYASRDPQSTAALARFDTNVDGRFDAAELKSLRDRAPDIRIDVTFDSATPGESRLSVVGLADEFAAAAESAALNPRSVTLQIGSDTVDFCAVQSTDSDQISIGAVNDGYPMLPVVDPNDDGRFTIRELRQLNQRLARFDHNGDGGLTRDETTSTIRLCFALGPVAHQELASLRSVQSASKEPAVKGPNWFVQMDVNKDNDVSAKEFPGNDEQFAELDADGDKLISAQEANAFEGKQ